MIFAKSTERIRSWLDSLLPNRRMPHLAAHVPAGCVPLCPGCQHRNLSAAESVAQKTNYLRRVLADWAELIAPIQSLPDEARWHYRDKVVLTTAWDSKRGWLFGMLRWDELIPIHACPVQSEQTTVLIGLLRRSMPDVSKFRMAYLVKSGKQVTLVVKAKTVLDEQWVSTITADLQQLGIEGLWLHLNPATGRKVFAKNSWRLLYGQAQSKDEYGYIYGPTAFQQLIPSLYHDSLAAALAHLKPDTTSKIVDLFCGRGISLAQWTSSGARVMGIELSGEAVTCAQSNAAAAQVLRGTCVTRLPQLDAWTSKHKMNLPLLYVNPPRSGLENELLDWILNHYRPARVAYLSCSAGTLRRDLQRFCAAGYLVKRIEPYDFFPQTQHVEALALLSKTEAA